MTVSTTQPQPASEEYDSGRRDFEAFLRDGQRDLVSGSAGESEFAMFFRALPADLRAPIATAVRRHAWPGVRDRLRPIAAPVAVSHESISGPPDSVVHGTTSGPPGRITRIDLLLEELDIDTCPSRRAAHSRDSVFLDVTTVDRRGAIAMTGNRICSRRECLPAAFCDRILASVDIDPADHEWPYSVSFEVDALEGAGDRLPDVFDAARACLHEDLSTTADSYVRAWLDCLTAWFTQSVTATPSAAAEVVMGPGVQFTATLTGPELTYRYRNAHTGRLIEISGDSLVRGRPMVHTFAAAGENLRARFRLGLRGSGSPIPEPAADLPARTAAIVGV